MTRAVKLDDAYIDQLLDLKQLAWLGRNAGGDASLMISNALGGIALPPDALAKYSSHVAKLDMAWAALTDLASGLPLPARFEEAVKSAKEGFLAPDYVALRLKTLTALIAGEKPAFAVNDWSKMSVAKLASLLGVAEASLDVAKDYAAAQRTQAIEKLGIQATFLIAAIVMALGMMFLVSRRVTGPLQEMQRRDAGACRRQFRCRAAGAWPQGRDRRRRAAVETFKVKSAEKARAEAEANADRELQGRRGESRARPHRGRGKGRGRTSVPRPSATRRWPR